MTDHPLSQLPHRGKEPNSKRTLDTWIQQAQQKTGVGAGRLSWMVASSVDVEVAPDEGQAAAGDETMPAPSLAHFGLPSPETVVGIAMNYQVAQKLHACTDPHQPPDVVNDRVRDVVDLLLIRDAFYDETDLPELAVVCRDLFASRAQEATELGVDPRSWPPVVEPNPLWYRDYAREAGEVGSDLPLEAAVEQVNTWVETISTH